MARVSAQAEAMLQQDVLWTFAFGSNMSTATLEGTRGVQPQEEFVGRVQHFGFTLGYRGIPIVEPAFAVIMQAPEGVDVCCWGVAYLISNSDMKKIIATEGPAYVPTAVTVESETGRKEQAIALALDPAKAWTANYQIFWSQRYRNMVLEGAREKALPARYISFLEVFPPNRHGWSDVPFLILGLPVYATLALGMGLAKFIRRWKLPGALWKAVITVSMGVSRVFAPALWWMYSLKPARLRQRLDLDALRAVASSGGETYAVIR